MRDILFRGRTIEGKEWVNGYYAVYSSYPFIGAPNSYGTMLWFEVHPETVGQFTGQVDMVGRKIFEGDVLKTEDRIVVVVWHDAAGCWDSNFIKYIEKPSTTGILCSQWRRRATIIGNIHDNPELLEG